MQVWIVEERFGYLIQSTILNICSTYEKALDYVRANMRSIQGGTEQAWFCITDFLVDQEISTSVVICIDRLGHISKASQPDMPLYLLDEWDEKI